MFPKIDMRLLLYYHAPPRYFGILTGRLFLEARLTINGDITYALFLPPHLLPRRSPLNPPLLLSTLAPSESSATPLHRVSTSRSLRCPASRSDAWIYASQRSSVSSHRHVPWRQR